MKEKTLWASPLRCFRCGREWTDVQTYLSADDLPWQRTVCPSCGVRYMDGLRDHYEYRQSREVRENGTK